MKSKMLIAILFHCTLFRRDLSRNALSTLHKDTFRGLTLLQELDLSNNILDYLPFDLLQDLDSLTQLLV